MDTVKAIFETLQRLDPSIKEDVLTYARGAYTGQENTKRRCGLPPEGHPAQAQGAQAGAGQA